MPRIALITPARNEAAHLPRLVESITGQTRRPDEWVIVSDGSTDATDEIAADAAARWSFVRYVRVESGTRDFRSKVAAFRHGISFLEAPYDYVGNADADVEYPHDYFTVLLAEFDADSSLGVIGGRVFDVDPRGGLRPLPGHPDIVPGATQMFRRACYESIGGYVPLLSGSEDTVACLSAQMNGWSVRVVDELVVLHYRSVGTADRSLLMARYREGLRDYAVGYHPLFSAAKAARRLFQRPAIIGAAARLVGYLHAAASRKGPEVDPEIVAFLRRRQLRQLRIGL